MDVLTPELKSTEARKQEVVCMEGRGGHRDQMRKNFCNIYA